MPGHSTKPILVACFATIGVFAGLGSTNQVAAQAPLRNGQPYAEAAKCAKPGVILCEDFDYPANISCTGTGGSQKFVWKNPALKSYPTMPGCQGSTYVPTSSVPTPPAGSPSGGYTRKVNAGGPGWIEGCIRGDCNRNTDDTDTTYVNGLPISKDLYFRFQMYYSTDYNFSQTLDNKIFFLWNDRFVDKPSARIDAGFYTTTATACNITGLFIKYPDALAFRYGSNSGSFKSIPARPNMTSPYSTYMEYCYGQGYGNSSPSILTQAIGLASGTPYPGQAFRFARGRWHTVEFRYKSGDKGVSNGTLEAWINSVKVYSEVNNIETCGGGSLGDCFVSQFAQGTWFNPFANPPENKQGYVLFDNLIISRNYIGSPGGGTGPSPSPSSPPAAPVNLNVAP